MEREWEWEKSENVFVLKIAWSDLYDILQCLLLDSRAPYCQLVGKGTSSDTNHLSHLSPTGLTVPGTDLLRQFVWKLWKTTVPGCHRPDSHPIHQRRSRSFFSKSGMSDFVSFRLWTSWIPWPTPCRLWHCRFRPCQHKRMMLTFLFEICFLLVWMVRFLST